MLDSNFNMLPMLRKCRPRMSYDQPSIFTKKSNCFTLIQAMHFGRNSLIFSILFLQQTHLFQYTNNTFFKTINMLFQDAPYFESKTDGPQSHAPLG